MFLKLQYHSVFHSEFRTWKYEHTLFLHVCAWKHFYGEYEKRGRLNARSEN
jgi:hypothetical protein